MDFDHQLVLLIPVTAAVQPTLFAGPPSPEEAPRLRFLFRRFKRPDETAYYCYVCDSCGMSIGIAWVEQGRLEMLQHDCRFRCNHLTSEVTDGGTKWIPAFRRGVCVRCQAPKHLTYMDGQ